VGTPAKALGLEPVGRISLAEAGGTRHIYTITSVVNASCVANRARKLGWEPTEKSHRHALAGEVAVLDWESEPIEYQYVESKMWGGGS